MVNVLTMKKAVQFGTEEQVDTFEVDSLKEYASMLWWTRQEVREIEDESETLIHFMNIHLNNADNICNDWNQYPIEIDTTIHSIRGLEKRTEIGAWEAYEVQRDARNAVLNQQDKHRMSKPNKLSRVASSFDLHEAVAKVYRVATLNARRTAYEVGLKDQFEAKRCHDAEAIAIPRQQQTTYLPTNPVARQLSKTILLTTEPICTKTRSNSPVQGVASNDIILESSSLSERKLTLDVSSHSNTLERIGMAPRPRFGISPMKKRRPVEVLETSTVVEQVEDVTKHAASPRRKKLTELPIDLNLLHIEHETKSERTECALVTPISRKKTIRKKKVDDSVVLGDSVIQALRDNSAVVIKKKKKKKSSSSSGDKSSGKGEVRKKRKSPKRSSSHDSSNGNNTTDTELMFDISNSSMSSNFDESFAEFGEFNGFGEFNDGESNNNDNFRFNQSCIDFFENSRRSKTSFQDSFVTL